MRGLVILGLIWASALPVTAQSLLRGEVRDGWSGETLPAVTVQIEGTTRGTVTNATGQFSIYVERLPAVLVIRHIGYRTLRHSVSGNDLVLELEPAPVELEEIVVSGEDPAVRIMRRVLEEKQRQRASYGSWYAEVYSRFLLYRDGALVQMTETIDATFWTEAAGNREVVRAKRVRPARSGRFRFASQIPVPNLTDDDIVLYGRRFVGPLHPDAFSTYRYTLAGTRRQDDRVVFDIAVNTRDPLAAGFVGALAVLDSSFVVLEARLRPLPGTPWSPPVLSRNLRLEQRFGRFRGGVWLPVDLRIEGEVSFGRLGSAYPRARYTQVSSLTLHAVDAPVPDSLRVRSDRLSEDPFADRRDDLFSWNPGLVPPTEAETDAIIRLDPRMTLPRAFRPIGVLAQYTAVAVTETTEPAPGRRLADLPWVRYDRVDGIFLGIRHTVSPVRGLALEARLGKPLDRPGLAHVLGLSANWLRYDARVEWRVDTEPIGGSNAYGRVLPGAMTYLGTDEYYDFFHARRGTAAFGVRAGPVRVSVGVRRSIDRSVSAHSDDDGAVVFNVQRPNPRIADDVYDALTGGLDVDHSVISARLDGALFRGGHLIGNGRVTVSVPTIFRRRENPGKLMVALVAGQAGTGVPNHYLQGVDVTTGPVTVASALASVRGTPWIGRRFEAVFVEQDFSTSIWERMGLLGIASRGFNLWVFAAAARVDGRAHREAGLALSQPFGLPIRVQVAVPFDTRRPVWALRLGLVRD